MVNETKYDTEIPEYEIETLARCLLPEIQKFFETEEGQQEFENWKVLQAKTKSPMKLQPSPYIEDDSFDDGDEQD